LGVLFFARLCAETGAFAAEAEVFAGFPFSGVRLRAVRVVRVVSARAGSAPSEVCSAAARRASSRRTVER